ncbi:YdcH family protein [Pseudomonas sp. BJa5]|uniref:YdcH family protein n=1 Tax=Pseudomonas sp. BJa5 TaxID=2936270 RepID=UPI00255A23F4|nr:YdcH family protein [Pseudomonas sp. BGr12]MDL2421277.1 YdcH family protein [Pseudomonas sp. BGr12]
MPVKHDLLADLNMTREAFDAKKKTDTRLSELHDKYNAIDVEVVKAESSSATDDQITQLRKKRLLIKDEIVAHLK